MNLASIIANRIALLKTFRSAIGREEEAWRDHKFQEIRERHLAPLVAENERFDRELAEVASSVTAANRRLDESR